MSSVTLIVNLRDSSGTPLDAPGIVNLHGGAQYSNRVATTTDATAAVFQGVTEGEYDAEAKCVGYVTTVEHFSLSALGSTQQVYIYMPRESEVKSDAPKPGGTVMSPKLQAEIDKGIDALRKHQFESARAHFAKGAQMAPGNPDVAYFLGLAEVGLQHTDLAFQAFQHALSVNPSHQRALLALGELQLKTGDPAPAIPTLEKAFQINGADWHTHFLLASAYAKAGRFSEAEPHAQRAASLAGEKGAAPYLLLGEVQQKEGKIQEARQAWQKLVDTFPKDPAAAEARADLAALLAPPRAAPEMQLASLPIHNLPSLELAPPSEQPWAPPDTDSLEYPVEQDPPCELTEVLSQAQRRLHSQLRNFEKFTATEHIEHQEIDRYGLPGAPRSRDFSYIVFVHPYRDNSFFLEEKRTAPGRDDNFPSAIATTGLNNLGVAVLQPAEKANLNFRCEGLAHVRGRSAWQIRFEEKAGTKESIRDWRRNGQLYPIPIKGRIWVSCASFDILRIQTDLRAPVEAIGLTRDHLTVDYGPVRFRSADTSLWLPWNAEMFMELRGHRYHHSHSLSDYMLFEVDTSNKISKPKDAPPPAPAVESSAANPR
jgi:tetratricopeptide (TPR) repeat protein